MSEREFDVVLYGASGFTGAFVLEEFFKSQISDRLRFAICGRNAKKLQKTLEKVADFVDRDLSAVQILEAKSEDFENLKKMAKRTRLVINVVGPYRLHGEAVVRACVQEGTHHVDISGEPAWLERMQLEYGEEAAKTGSYVVGACGWDSIPCDLGVGFLKKNFNSKLSYIETFVQIKRGEAGYVFNDGTYQTLILGLSAASTDGLGKIRRALMPKKFEKPKTPPPKRPSVWFNKTLDSYCIPFLGADKSVVQRSQYSKEDIVPVETYLTTQSWFWAWCGILWMLIFSKLIKFDKIRTFLQKYPTVGSGGIFSPSGPTREQCKQASFTYWFEGFGEEKKLVCRCDGPDSGYIATAGCVLSSALTILEDHDQLPKSGGVFTPFSAFENTRLLERLATFGITFRVDEQKTSMIQQEN